MTENELKNKYFEWMIQLVCEGQRVRRSNYRKLLLFLFETSFNYSIEMDSNRAEDGMDLRYRFGYETGLEGPEIATYLDNRDCSILEMLVALAVRCENQIMENRDIGNRTGVWFWNMISSLGLDFADDANFTRGLITGIITRFLNREYQRDGQGGLFTIRNCVHDLRFVEIWYQMCWYLDSILRKENF